MTSTSTNPTPEPTSPLTTENLSAMDIAFTRDPREWSEDLVLNMIEELRAARKDLDVDQKPKAKAKVKAEITAKVANLSDEDLLKELGI
jgi:predicted secreted Zn-dependent protease